MRTLVASDLDRTLIYSANAMALGSDHGDVRCVEIYQGNEQSFSTVRSLEILQELRSSAQFVPVTTRTPEQYGRVNLFENTPEFAVCSNGGDLLVDGQLDQDWHRYLHGVVAAESSPLDEVAEHMASTLAVHADAVRLRRAADLFAYVVFDGVAVDRTWVSELNEWAEARGYTVSAQGRKVYCVPRSLRKSKAIAEVRKRCGLEQVIAAGDSVLDADLLEYADLAIRPAHGELHELGWTRENLQVTAHSGAKAGEEVAEWFQQQVFDGR